MSKEELDSETGEPDRPESIGSQLSTYERQLRGTLHNLDAKIGSYHFSIERKATGLPST